MNNKVVLKIVVICAAVFVVFGIFAAIFAVGTSWDNFYSSERFSIGRGDPFEYHKNEEFDLDGVKKINIGTVSSDVILYESESQLEVTLDCKGYSKTESITLETEKVGSTINVTVKYPKVFFSSFNLTEGVLQIGIPKDYAESIQIDGVSSRVEMNSFLKNSFDTFDVDTVSGDIYVSCTEIGTLKVSSTSGELDVEQTVLKTVNADTTSGDITISNLSSSSEKVDVDSTSGRITLSYDELCETRVNTVSGDVTLSIPADTKIDLDFDSVSGDLRGDYNKSSEGIYIYVDTTSGDLTIH